MTRDQIRALAREQESRLLAYRHHLHENPELSFREADTSRFIREKLESFGLSVESGFSGYSVVARLDSGRPGPVILFRADMDALPLQEAAEWAHRSRRDGVMHACGHDVHVAVLLSLAEILTARPGLLAKGAVRFCFESGEETLPGGAVALVREGVCEGVDMVFALHCGHSETGSIVITPGHATLGTGNFVITVEGRGGHTGIPQKAVNPVAVLRDIAAAVERIVPYRLDPARANTVSVSFIRAGTPERLNVIPAGGRLGGTVRCLYREDQEAVYGEIRRVADAVCAVHGCTCETRITDGHPGLVNDDACLDEIRRAAALLGLTCLAPPPVTAGDDFSIFQMAKPGGYFSLGLSDPRKPEVNVLHHNPAFFIDEEGIVSGLEMFLALTASLCGD